MFLFGIEKAGINHLFYTVKAIQNNKEISSVTINGFTGILKDHRFELLSNKGLENVDDIINIHGYSEFCGDDSGQHVLFWGKENCSMSNCSNLVLTHLISTQNHLFIRRKLKVKKVLF